MIQPYHYFPTMLLLPFGRCHDVRDVYTPEPIADAPSINDI
jgi:hypothetical protein